MRTDHMDHIMCRREGRPTDWLTLLPQTTLIDIMQRRCSLIGGSIRASYAFGPFVPLAEYEIRHQESMFQMAYMSYRY